MNNKKLTITKSTLKNVNKKIPRGLKDGFIALFFGILIGSVFILISGNNPFKVIYVIATSWTKAKFTVGDLISIMSFYLIAGSASIIASKAGLFNIGIGAQMMLGGILAYLLAFHTDMAKAYSIITSLLIAAVTGMIIALIIILLKIFFNIHEVLSSIMVNWIAFYIYKWLFNSSSKPWVTENLEGVLIAKQDSLRVNWLTNLFPNSQINLGVIIAITVVILLYGLLKFTVFGRKIKMIGLNFSGSKAAGISVKITLIKVMLLSGALAGISGVVFFFGVNQNIPLYRDGLPGQYFNAIAVAMLGANNPLGIILSGFLFSMIYTSQDTLAVMGISFEVSQLLLSVIMYSIVLSIIVKKYHLIEWIKNKINENKMKNEHIKKYKSKPFESEGEK